MKNSNNTSWDGTSDLPICNTAPVVSLEDTRLPAHLSLSHPLDQRFSTAGPRLGTGPWHQLYRAARGSPGICHFSFLSNYHEYMFYSGNILRRKIFVNVSKNSDPDVCLRKLHMLQYFVSPVIDIQFKCNFIFVNMLHRIHKWTNSLYDYATINY